MAVKIVRQPKNVCPAGRSYKRGSDCARGARGRRKRCVQLDY